ncbi:MAG: hypothetical protein CBB70_12795 [Planctomycetaceae bacterium TMED10]|nr:MAG: hypothetical protein CBB70_12795 [Planctomycetaceae bacterium TMED10]
MRSTMGFIGGKLGYRLLKAVSDDGETGYLDGSAYHNKSKLATLLGADIWNQTNNKIVVDFGCGTGTESVEMAEHGAKKVIGVEIQRKRREQARNRAEKHGVSGHCVFTSRIRETADVIVSLDAFEHFQNPAEILEAMRHMLSPHGSVFAAFGPTWYHPLGGHLFSVFPWAHLIFTEQALIRWRSTVRSDGATRFDEVEGGLNQMTIRRFEKIVARSPFRFEELDTVPIQKLQRFACRMTREFTTAIVRCKLVPR